MGTTYLYPSGNLSSSEGWTGVSAELWNNIDEGVTTSNDSDYNVNSKGFQDGGSKQLTFSSIPSLVNFDHIVNVSGSWRFQNPEYVSPSAIAIDIILNDNLGSLIASGRFSESVSGEWGSFHKPLTIFNTDPIGGHHQLKISFGDSTNPTGITNDLQLSAFDIHVESTGDAVITGSNMNLYMGSVEPNSSSGNIPLYTQGTPIGTGQLFGTIPLFIDGRNSESGLFNLYIGGKQNPVGINDNLNLFIGESRSVDSSGWVYKTAPLYIANSSVIESNNITFYIHGPQVGSSGFIPASSIMNLFINRQYESVSHNLPLYIAGPSGYNETLTLFLEGQPNSRNNIPMYVQADAQDNTSNIILYTHGN